MVQSPDTVRRRKMESRIIIISIHFREKVSVEKMRLRMMKNWQRQRQQNSSRVVKRHIF